MGGNDSVAKHKEKAKKLTRHHATTISQTGLAQLVEREAFNLKVAGSTPAIGTFF